MSSDSGESVEVESDYFEPYRQPRLSEYHRSYDDGELRSVTIEIGGADGVTLQFKSTGRSSLALTSIDPGDAGILYAEQFAAVRRAVSEAAEEFDVDLGPLAGLGMSQSVSELFSEAARETVPEAKPPGSTSEGGSKRTDGGTTTAPTFDADDEKALTLTSQTRTHLPRRYPAQLPSAVRRVPRTHEENLTPAIRRVPRALDDGLEPTIRRVPRALDTDLTPAIRRVPRGMRDGLEPAITPAWDPDSEADLRAAYDEAETLADAARRFPTVSYSAIRHRLITAGIHSPGPPEPRELRDDLVPAIIRSRMPSPGGPRELRYQPRSAMKRVRAEDADVEWCRICGEGPFGQLQNHHVSKHRGLPASIDHEPTEDELVSETRDAEGLPDWLAVSPETTMESMPQDFTQSLEEVLYEVETQDGYLNVNRRLGTDSLQTTRRLLAGLGLLTDARTGFHPDYEERVETLREIADE